MKGLLVMLLVLLGLFVLALVAAGTPLGGEVVVLRTTEVDGTTHETRLWIQDLDRQLWLRAGSTDSGWYRRLVQRPIVQMKRQGRWERYRAIPTPHRTQEVSNAIARKYGWSDWLIGLFRDPEKSVAIRLAPVPG
jgi:hypothetical protein